MSQELIPKSYYYPSTVVNIKGHTFIVDLHDGFSIVKEGTVQEGDRICFFEEVNDSPFFYHWNESLEEEYGLDVKQFFVVIRKNNVSV
jgi:hypothetical protein